MKHPDSDVEDHDARRLSGDAEVGQPTLSQIRLKSEVLASVLIVGVLLGTVLLSLLVLSAHVTLVDTVIQPQTDFSARYYDYGIGIFHYDLTKKSHDNAQVTLLLLSENDHKDFVSGKPYNAIWTVSVGPYAYQRSGNIPAITGVAYIVVINEDHQAPATVDLEYDMTVYFSVLIAAPLTAAALLIYFMPRFIGMPHKPDKNP